MIRFRCEASSGAARAGVLTTAHGEIPTPAFMPVATQACVKALAPDEVVRTGSRMVIMNTYHLWLRPGSGLIRQHGGVHAFSRWPHAIVTDSGGFQAFSLAGLSTAGEDGFEFRSHLDGTRLLLSPEESMRVQGELGSDIAMQLDVCPPAGASGSELLSAVERTTRWARRSLESRDPNQAVFGIVQGGTLAELRRRHAAELAELPVDGLALGGFSVGEPREEMFRALAAVGPVLDPARPHYLMGVGTPPDLIDAIGLGIDMFDCVMPTRNARNGQAFVGSGKIVIKNARYRDDPRPIEEGCPCAACASGFSRAYLRHLFLAREILALRLLTQHNLSYYQRTVSGAREAIVAGEFARWSAVQRDRLAARNETEPREGGLT